MTLNITPTEQKYFDELVVKVLLWSQTHALEQYLNEARSSFWTSALEAGVITQDEYDFAKNHYSYMWIQDMWNYVSDKKED